MIRERIYVDTGGWIALVSSKDQYHRRAEDFYRSLPSSMMRVTSSHIIAETYTWLRYKAGFHSASRFLAIIREACRMNYLMMETDDPNILAQAEQILGDFPDQDLSYVDAISMAVMQRQRIRKVFGFDRHFQLMEFELLP